MVHVLLRTMFLLLLGAACASTAVRRAPMDPTLPPVERGRILYETSCNKCHALWMPSSYGAGEWPFYVRKYGRKARLSAEERDLVLAYLQANARE
jgi:cytochrome c5